MRAYFDTEYLIRCKKARFVSIAIVLEDGRELHRVAADFKPDTLTPNEWFFKKKVWAKIEHLPRTKRPQIALDIREFLTGVTVLVHRGGLDAQMLKQVIGGHDYRIYDIQKIWMGMGEPPMPKRTDGTNHHTGADARWHQTLFHHLLDNHLRAA